jgi:uncharacterized UPF0160 family protein
VFLPLSFYSVFVKTIITHSGNFHADDVCAVATLQLYYGTENIQVIRTRDVAIIQTGDIVLDVGGVYDPERGRFDHHQAGAPVRENGIPYAAFGLIWREYGEKVCGSSEVAEHIENLLVQSVDAGDNAVSLYTPIYSEIHPFEFYQVISSYMPASDEDADKDMAFLEAAAWARGLLERLIEQAKLRLEAEAVVAKLYHESRDTTVLVSDKPINVRFAIKYSDILFIVSPRTNDLRGHWKVTAVPKNYDTFATRMPFPQAWQSLRDVELQQVSGIHDAVFCHKTGYLCVVGSKESALKVVEMMLGSRHE